MVALVTIHGFGDYRKEPAKAVPGLIELLNDPEVETRWGAAQTLAAIGPPAKEAVPALTKLLQDKNLSVGERRTLCARADSGKVICTRSASRERERPECSPVAHAPGSPIPLTSSPVRSTRG